MRPGGHYHHHHHHRNHTIILNISSLRISYTEVWSHLPLPWLFSSPPVFPTYTTVFFFLFLTNQDQFVLPIFFWSVICLGLAQVLWMLWQPLWAHSEVALLFPEDTGSHLSTVSGSYNLSSSFHNDAWAWGRFLICMFHSRLNILKFLIPCTLGR